MFLLTLSFEADMEGTCRWTLGDYWAPLEVIVGRQSPDYPQGLVFAHGFMVLINYYSESRYKVKEYTRNFIFFPGNIPTISSRWMNVSILTVFIIYYYLYLINYYSQKSTIVENQFLNWKLNVHIGIQVHLHIFYISGVNMNICMCLYWFVRMLVCVYCVDLTYVQGESCSGHTPWPLTRRVRLPIKHQSTRIASNHALYIA